MTRLALPSLPAAARLVAGNDRVELRSDEATPLLVRIVGGFGPYLHAICATRPALPRSLLWCRVLAADGEPWVVTIRVSGDHTVDGERTALTLEVVRVASATHVRQQPRTAIRGSAWLAAVECAQLSTGAMIDAAPIDISTAGIGLATDGDLRLADLLQLHARLAGEKLTVRVHIASIRRSQTLRQNIVGCTFLSTSPASQATLDRIIHHQTTHSPGAPLGANPISPPNSKRPARPGAATRAQRVMNDGANDAHDPRLTPTAKRSTGGRRPAHTLEVHHQREAASTAPSGRNARTTGR